MKRVIWRILVVGCAYAIVGVATGDLARSAPSIKMRDAWRFAGWILSAIVFVADLAFDRSPAGGTPAPPARRAAAAVAFGAFVLALVGPVQSYWGTERFWRVTVLSLLVWPILAGVPAFIAALAGGTIRRRLLAKSERL